MRCAALGLALAALLAGCAGPDVKDYAQEKPTLDLREYFNGPLTAQGMFTDRAGKVVKRFSVQMTGRWEGDDGTLDEHFVYSDGTTQRRVWRLKHLGDGRYSGRAADVIGEAAGQTAGNASIGSTRWPCPSTAACGTSISTTGCTAWTRACCSIAPP